MIVAVVRRYGIELGGGGGGVESSAGVYEGGLRERWARDGSRERDVWEGRRLSV